MEKQYGPRRRCITLRVPRSVFYELTEWCLARDLSLHEYLEGVACVLANQIRLLDSSPFAGKEVFE